MKKIMESIGTYKEFALGCISGIYVLGYCMWALNAKRNNLGIMPALEMQYFFSGLFPFFTLVIVFYSYSKTKAVVERICFFVEQNKYDKPVVFGAFGLVPAFTFAIYLAVVKLERLPAPDFKSSIFFFYILMLLAASILYGIIGSILIRSAIRIYPRKSIPDRVNGDNWLSQVRKWFKKFTIKYFDSTLLLYFMLAGSIAILYFVAKLYPMIPQELGGVKPKHACIALEKEFVETLGSQLIFAINSVCSEADSTNQVSVFYKGGDYLLLKLENANDTYEIKYSDVKYIKWK